MSFHTGIVRGSRIGLIGVAAAVIFGIAAGEHLPALASESACEKLSDPRRALCLEAIEKRNELMEVDTTRREEIREDSRTLPEVIAASKTSIEVICKLRANHTIDCLPVSTMIAYLSSTAALDAIIDLNEIAEIYGIEELIAVKCPDDIWTGLEIEFDTSRTITDLDAASMEDSCSQQESDIADMTSGLLSGISGNHPPLNCFRFSSESAGPSHEDNMRALTDWTTNYMNSCVVPEVDDTPLSELTGFVQTMMEGAAPQDPPDEEYTGSQVESIEYSNGDEVKVITTTLNDGTVTRQSTNTRTGQLKTTTTGPDGLLVSQSAINNDGSGWDRSMNEDTGVLETTRYGSGGEVTGSESTNSNGDTIYFDKDGIPYRVVDRNGNERRVTSSGHVLPPDDSINCDPSNTACDRCPAARETLELASDACLVSGGASGTCQAYLNASACCTNPPDLGGGPGLAMPNPEGELVCVDGSASLVGDRCKQMCKYAATPVDCEQQCMASRTMNIQHDLIDNMCLYVMSPDGGVCAHKDGFRDSNVIDAAGFLVTPDFSRFDKGMFVIPPTTCPSGECALFSPPQ